MMAFCERMYFPPSDAKAAAVEDIKGPPFCCRGCGAALCFYSKILRKDEYDQKMVAEEFPEELDDIQKAEAINKGKDSEFTKGKFYKDLQDNDRVWICEFCDVHNKVDKDLVVPETEDQLYLLKKGTGPKPKDEEETKLSDGKSNTNSEDGTNMVFCIDISGSMSTNHETNHDGRRSQVTRLKLISDAVLRQIETMKEIYPNRKTGLILFGSNVALKGDCTQKEVVLNSDLDNFGKLLNYSKLKGQSLLTQPLTDSFPALSSTIKKLQSGGGTALGPALLCGVSLASQGGHGSKVILCTDGLANIGLGVLENPKDPEASHAFYERVGNVAAESGVSISIITIQGNACRVDALGPLTDRTAGTITRVDPANFDLSEIAANNLVATKVSLKAILHEALSFQNEDARNLHNNNSILMKEVGSVSEENEVYFEYKVKNTEELKKEMMNIENLEWIPLQSQIKYRDLSGNEFVRVICKKQLLTKDHEEVHKEAKPEVLAKFIQKESADHVLKGDVSGAKSKNKKWDSYLSHAANNANISKEKKQAFLDIQQDNDDIGMLIQQTEKVQGGMNVVERDDVDAQWYGKKQKKKR